MRFENVQAVPIILIICFLSEIVSRVEFTNIKCISHDLEFAEVEYCYLKSVNRSYKYASMKTKLYKTPINDATVNLAVFKRMSGYKPFLYNVTVDGCKFLKHKKSYPVANYLYSLFGSHSNMNHSCPYDHDIIVDKLTTDFLNSQVTKVLPFPEGDYLLKTKWFVYGILRVSINVYITLS
ncbi:uncharacterized protein LOC108046794 [Drosophila rhopaloa]|uniref:Uncharacterized protein LOC108046794 n=1 Tax=Drosophila rhopaloa TaxID=1041015 RepID=A0A6P4EVL9_DRORH|nr:uncharacterized protein LOC108046794 [Drosophila rhopaloa]